MRNNLPVRYTRNEISHENQDDSQRLPIVYEQHAPSRSLESEYAIPQYQSRTIIDSGESLTSDRNPAEKNNCKIHQDQRAVYFLSEQPWVRLCKQCALNKALCGHQIEKELTHEEFEKKIVLTTLMQEIKNIMLVSETQGKYLGEVAEKIDKSYVENVSGTVKAIDQLLKELNKIRQSLYSLYEDNVSKKINECYERQGHLVNCTNSLKKHLQNIESNFGDLIAEDEDQGEQFTRQVSLVRSEIERARKGVFMDFQKYELERTASNIVELFLPKIEELKKKNILLGDIEIKVLKPEIVPEIQAQISEKKPASKIPQRQSTTFRKQQPKQPKYLSCRRRSIKNIDQNSETLISIQSHRPSLALRSNSKKHVNSSSNMQNSQKKPGLKESTTSLFNSQQNSGEPIFQY